MMKLKAILLCVALVSAIFTAAPITAAPTASNFGVGDSNGYHSTTCAIPVSLTGASEAIISVIFNFRYDKSVLQLDDVQLGDLTSDWDAPTVNDAFDWGVRIALVYDGNIGRAIQAGATGPVLYLNFTVLGEPGATSIMNFDDIQLSGTDYILGYAPPKNGIFAVNEYAVIEGRVINTASPEIGLENATITLYNLDMSVYRTGQTGEYGALNFTDVTIGYYWMTISKSGYYRTGLLVSAIGNATLGNIPLYRKGDLNNNGVAADVGDLAMMKDAAVGKIEIT